MADSGKRAPSHLDFFLALLVVVALGAGAYWVYAKYIVPVADQQATAAANPPSRAHPKDADKKPGEPAATTAATPAGGAAAPAATAGKPTE